MDVASGTFDPSDFQKITKTPLKWTVQILTSLPPYVQQNIYRYNRNIFIFVNFSKMSYFTNIIFCME